MGTLTQAPPRYRMYDILSSAFTQFSELTRRSTTTVSEIAVVRCLFDLTMHDMCALSSSPSENAIKGKWVRVPHDLNFQFGMWHLVRGFLFCLLYVQRGPNHGCDAATVFIDAPADETYRLYRISNSSPLTRRRLAVETGSKPRARCAMALCAHRHSSCGIAKTRRSKIYRKMSGNP
jgi:hypothetical protein